MTNDIIIIHYVINVNIYDEIFTYFLSRGYVDLVGEKWYNYRILQK